MKRLEKDIPTHNQYGVDLRNVSEEIKRQGRKIAWEMWNLEKLPGNTHGKKVICFMCNTGKEREFNSNFHCHLATCAKDAMQWAVSNLSLFSKRKRQNSYR